MVVENDGYLSIKEVETLHRQGVEFSIYETAKKTNILVKKASATKIDLWHPDSSRLQWKVVEGTKITYDAKRIFNSSTDNILQLNITNWNNGNQIMSYSPAMPFY